MDKKNPTKSLNIEKVETLAPLNEGDSTQIKIEKPVEPEKVVIYKNKRRGCFGLGCNAIGCLFILLILSCCIGTIFVIINRPAFIWDRVVSYLNEGIQLPEYKPSSSNYVEESILSSIKNGQNDVYITEDQLTTLARERLIQFKDLRFDIENGELTMYWALDNSPNPVYADVKLRVENNNLKIYKVGTPNLTLPEFTNNAINQLLLSLLNLNGGGGDKNILNTILLDNSNIQVNKVEFQKDRLYLDIFINVNLFQ